MCSRFPACINVLIHALSLAVLNNGHGDLNKWRAAALATLTKHICPRLPP